MIGAVALENASVVSPTTVLSSIAKSAGLGVCAKSLSNIVKFAVLKMLLAVLQNLLVWESVPKGLLQLALAGPVLGS